MCSIKAIFQERGQNEKHFQINGDSLPLAYPHQRTVGFQGEENYQFIIVKKTLAHERRKFP